MTCQRCKQEATEWEIGFYGSCGECSNKENRNKPTTGLWTRHTNVDRNLFAKDLLQPVKNGKINKDFVQAHGTKTLEKEWKITKKEIESNL
jgi:hypothetical protein